MKIFIIALLIANSIAAFSQDRLNEIVKTETAFIENFSSNYRNWPQSENDSVGLKVINEVYYTMASKTNILLPRRVSANLSSKRNLWRLSAEVTYADGNSYFGLLFGSFDSKITYAFMINGGGNYVILQIEGSKNSVLKQGKSAKINTGKNAINILSVETDNDYYYNFPNTQFLVNGREVDQPTKAEQTKLDAAAAEKNKDAKDAYKKFTIEDMEEMSKDFALRRIDPENFGDGKIGIITTRGAAANFDNLWLETKPNKGRTVMYNNKWSKDPYFFKYLAKDIAAEEQVKRQEQQNKKLADTESDLKKAKAAIARLPASLLHPFGNTVAAAVPNEKAVVWLQRFVIEMQGYVGNPLYTYPEKDLLKKEDSTEIYTVKHYLPAVNFSAQIVIGTKTKKAKCVIQLASDVSTENATTLCSNYLANMAAAFDKTSNVYIDNDNATGGKIIPRTLYISEGKNTIIKSYVIAKVEPLPNKQGGWDVLLVLFGE